MMTKIHSTDYTTKLEWLYPNTCHIDIYECKPAKILKSCT